MNKCPLYGQMETWGLKSTSGKQSSAQYCLTSHKKFTKPHHPLQEKIRLVSIFLQFCFISGEQMSTLWTNGSRGLKSSSGKQLPANIILWPHARSLPSPTILFNKKFAKFSIFSQFCIIPGEQMSTLWANGGRGLKSSSGKQLAANIIL